MPYKDKEVRREKQREYAARHYEANKTNVKKRAVASKTDVRKRNVEYIQQYKAEHPCVDCGNTNPIVLEFDHLGYSIKLGDIAHMARCHSLNTIKAEIEKCEVVCANCHRIRTHNRRKQAGLEVIVN